MNKQLFVKAGVAAFGDSWQAQIQRALNDISDKQIKSRQRISQWSKGTREIPSIENELLILLKSRKREIEEVINDLEKSL